MDAAEERLLALAVRQAGCFSLRQARTSGVPARAVSRRVAAGTFLRVQPATYRFAAIPVRDGTPSWAAVLAVPGSAAGGRAALWRLGLLPVPPARPQIVVATGCRPRGLASARVLRSDTVLSTARSVRGMRVVPCAPALVGLLCDEGPRAVDVLDHALQVGAVDLGELADALGLVSGVRGLAGARHLLVVASDGAVSEAERLAGRLLRAAGLSGFEANGRVGRFRGDIVYRAQRVLVEVDGLAVHSGARVFRSDRVRQNLLVLADWTVLRFTWRDLVDSPERVVATVARALGRVPASSGR